MKFLDPLDLDIQFFILADHLADKGLHKSQINAILSTSFQKGLNTFTLKEIDRQIAFMVQKIKQGEIDFRTDEGFAKYFVSGVQNMIKQSDIIKEHEREMLIQQQIQKQKRSDRNLEVYYNWLEE